MSGDRRITRERRNMSLPFGCAHQLPRIGAPATRSARLGTLACADSTAMPHCCTQEMACFACMTILVRPDCFTFRVSRVSSRAWTSRQTWTFRGRHVIPVPVKLPESFEFHLLNVPVPKRNIDRAGKLHILREVRGNS